MATSSAFSRARARSARSASVTTTVAVVPMARNEREAMPEVDPGVVPLSSVCASSAIVVEVMTAPRR